MNWSGVGVTGGIPSGNWTQCGSTIPSTATAATIQSTLSSCAPNQYIQLAAGTFNLSTGLVLNSQNNLAIRGMGADQTILVFTGKAGCQGQTAPICFQSSDVNYWGAPTNTANWTAGYSQGSTTITLDSVNNLKVGNPITLDQTDDLITADTGAILICYLNTSSGNCSTNNDNGGGPRTGRSEQQIVTVASCDGNSTFGHACSSGTNITITPAIVMPNWVSAKSPQAWWATNPIQWVGVENLTINGSGSGGNSSVAFFNCQNCWVEGIRTIGPNGRDHVMIFQSNLITVQNNYFYKTNDNASINYGVESLPAANALIENNIFEQIQAPYITNGTCGGCVFAYNFDVNNVFAGGIWMQPSTPVHAVGNEHILYEGNEGAGTYSDNFHGTHHFQTYFRNYWNGYQKNEGNFTTNPTAPVLFNAYSRFYNLIGNVLGNPEQHANYAALVGAYNGNGVGAVGSGDGVSNDPNVALTLMQWGNFANCSGVSPCQTSLFSASQVPSALTGTQAPFSNSVPSSDTLPASFFLSAQPSWWPSAIPWPPVGPDVTGGNVSYCTGGTYTGTYVVSSAQCPGGTTKLLAGGRIYANPAMSCYLNTMGGAPDGTGNVLTFSADKCYPTSSSSSPPPSPPTGLTATVK